ncbi:hypothetical protein llap_17372 [Limosa lapponica baueri]|uniref:Uncharacterized protein n=1 Tax=Limosa lapponica baueri TaxID=1758121 RepID=A0A2I0TEU8_LIMLA|nr:hypothetical protein llap_17372 [Limosa lapponica baueri]
MMADIEGQIATIAGDAVKKGNEEEEKYIVQKGTAENNVLVLKTKQSKKKPKNKKQKKKKTNKKTKPNQKNPQKNQDSLSQKTHSEACLIIT